MNNKVLRHRQTNLFVEIIFSFVFFGKLSIFFFFSFSTWKVISLWTHRFVNWKTSVDFFLLKKSFSSFPLFSQADNLVNRELAKNNKRKNKCELYQFNYTMDMLVKGLNWINNVKSYKELPSYICKTIVFA